MSDEKQEGVDRVTLGNQSIKGAKIPLEDHFAVVKHVEGTHRQERANAQIRDLALGHALTTLAKHIGLSADHADKVIPLAAKYEDYLLNGLKDETHGA